VSPDASKKWIKTFVSGNISKDELDESRLEELNSSDLM